MKSYLRLFGYIKPYALRLFFALLCTALAAAGNLYVPWIARDIIDEVLTARDAVMLNVIALGIVAVFLARGLFFFGQSYLMAYVGQKVIIDIRAQVYRKLNQLSLSFYEKNKTGAIMSYVTNDVAALQGAMAQSVVDMFTEGLILIGSVLAMFWLDWKLTLFTCATFPVVLYIINVFGKKIQAAGHRIQERTADITSLLQETIFAARIVKSFAREDYEIAKFDRENMRNFRAYMKNAQLGAVLTPVIEFTAALGVTAIIWYGGREVIDGRTTAGSLIAFLIYAVNISNPIKRLTRVFAEIQRAMAAAQRVFGVLDIPPAVVDKPDARILPPVRGEVSFDNVSFGYNPGEPVLNGLTFTAGAGRLVALVGPSGAGKTTVSNLLSRFYEVTGGAITVDGVNINDVTMASLRGQIGIVPQETVLFNGSVYDNILYGRLDAGRDEVIAAARSANADSFINELAQGYDSMLGDRGSNLSGGQRQRISIARALLKNPRILVLDEATSALDAESEKIVQEALDRLMVGRTSFVIAHRLSTVQRADIILVLNRGRLQEAGTHESLMAAGGLYFNLYQAQFSEKDVSPASPHDENSLTEMEQANAVCNL